MKIDLIVTRHPAMKAFLIEHGIADESTPCVAHASAADVEGKHVAGVLPLFLAAKAASLTTVDLALPLEKRGVELSLADMRKYVRGLATYSVARVM